MDGRKGTNGAYLGKLVGDITREDIPKFLYDLSVEIDSLGITYDEFVKNNTNNLEAIVNKYLV